MAKRKSWEEQDIMVVSLVKNLHEQNYSDIRAAVPGHEKPDEIYWEATQKGYIPDVVAVKDWEYIFSAETDDSILNAGTADKWRLFSAYVQQQSKKFVIVVPKESEEKTRQLVKDLGIKADGIWSVA